MVRGQKGRSQGREIGERSRASGDGRDDHIEGHQDDDDHHDIDGHHDDDDDDHGRDDHIEGHQDDDEE